MSLRQSFCNGSDKLFRTGSVRITCDVEFGDHESSEPWRAEKYPQSLHRLRKAQTVLVRNIGHREITGIDHVDIEVNQDVPRPVFQSLKSFP